MSALIEGGHVLTVLWVGAGGFIGAALRYGVGLLMPAGDFPWATFLVNFVGALAIGAIVEVASRGAFANSDGLLLFLKTGLCGGFTTFSTFSLEVLDLLERHQIALGSVYAGASLVCCVLGVLAGKMLVRALQSFGGAVS